jgi:hypothetical protein
MSVEIITTEKRKARKRHRCTWCGEWIGIGETYTHERVRVDGDMGVNKLHAECDEALSELAAYEGGTCTYTPYDNERPTVSENAKP